MIDAKFEKPKLATLCMQLTLENTGLNQTSRTLVQIQNFCHYHNEQVKYFTEMYSVFTGTFSRSGRTSAGAVASRFMAFSPLKWVKVGDQVQRAGLTDCRGSLPAAFPDEEACEFGLEICRGGDRVQQQGG